MPILTLQQIRKRVRRLGDYENAPRITDEFLDDSINEGLSELLEIVTDAFQGHYAKLATITTVDGEATVELPEDYADLRLLERDTGVDRFQPMRRLTLVQVGRYPGRGCPVGYMLHGPSEELGSVGTIRLFPTPDAAYDLRITYDALFPTLAEDDDAMDFRNGWDKYVVNYALMKVEDREERPLGERMAILEKLEKRIRSSASKRDSAEPEYLVPRSGEWSDPAGSES